MKLEDKFFTAFFYPFLIAIFLSALIITLFISLFTNNNFDKITSQYILDLENKYSKRNINTVNVLVTSSLLKIQSSLNEQILFYQKTANKILNSTQPYELNNNNLICALDIDEDFCENNLEETATLAVWLLDSDTNEENLDLDDSKNDVKLQLIAYTNIIENIDASFEGIGRNISLVESQEDSIVRSCFLVDQAPCHQILDEIGIQSSFRRQIEEDFRIAVIGFWEQQTCVTLLPWDLHHRRQIVHQIPEIETGIFKVIAFNLDQVIQRGYSSDFTVCPPAPLAVGYLQGSVAFQAVAVISSHTDQFIRLVILEVGKDIQLLDFLDLLLGQSFCHLSISSFFFSTMRLMP